ncbi:uncharacterized protein CIMG_01217 [Coccidioides immitis RS]|uniref:Uncharacterized protein n=2 Tax=Coccidioides immitis TaxID=5501 RepID=J3KIQ0_COCIM|nr:uncharacterized protein CIMG_01217 [Coccidioides immitis RS]EAS35863.3 hypothetical protein CIMG_01217 [Coccidioides immitis RS]KMP01153.1 hypothetical protein CIRG_01293 [Coccidioides immitis RMSCC 2394]TPX25939.1 hypothetical protein DIZ76_011397 [Coccidioides immitis]
MPSFVAPCSPQAQGPVARLPLDDEWYVMERYAAHASHCAPCAHPYTTLRTGQSLCARGARHVTNMAQYVYTHNGKAYSVAAKNRGLVHEIEIPANFEAVSELMRALEYGLKIKKAQARVVVHDQRSDAEQGPATPVTPAGPQMLETPVAMQPGNRDDSKALTIQQTKAVQKRPDDGNLRGTLYKEDLSVKPLEKHYTGPRIKTPHQYLR